jgi:hypothetical protein
MQIRLAAILLILAGAGVRAAESDWAEGTPGTAHGATRDYYNRAGLLEWKNRLGDWHDADGAAQGTRAYATADILDNDTPRRVTWDVTALVREWLEGEHPNQGLLLHAVAGTGSCHFRSREHDESEEQPHLVLDVGLQGLEGDLTGLKMRLFPVADTHLDPSTYRSLGDADVLRVTKDANNTLLRFDLSDLVEKVTVRRALLSLFTQAQYGGGQLTVGVFRCSQSHAAPDVAPKPGLASRYPGDRGIKKDPNVIFQDSFESGDWAESWSFAQGTMDLVASDPAREFEMFRGKALRVRIAAGSNAALNLGYKFRKETGTEPESIYLRYYLRLGDDWNQTIEGGKMPGISGTYGTAGWGGRRSDGTNGWSARGAFHRSIPMDNPLAGTHPIGTYCYHADQEGPYGNIWLWKRGYRGFLRKNRWYSVEQHLRLNTPGRKDGVIRAWIDGRLAFEKTDIRFRLVDTLRIEQIWMNVYHGGKRPSPHEQHLFIDNVVVASEYIGPLEPTTDS